MVALGGESKRKLFLLAPQSFPPLFKPLLVFSNLYARILIIPGQMGSKWVQGKKWGLTLILNFSEKIGGLEP